LKKYRVWEDGCPLGKYKWTPPELRPLKHAGKRRYRKQTTIYLSTENVEFIKNRFVPSYPKQYFGYFSRGMGGCIERFLKKLDGNIPNVPIADRLIVGEAKNITILPEVLEAVDRIVEYWKGTNGQVNRSQVVDYFCTLTRLQFAKADKKRMEMTDEKI
jgi:hypothetical protein